MKKRVGTTAPEKGFASFFGGDSRSSIAGEN
jgi:hypothetical protein